jgi:hypothetical protein
VPEFLQASNESRSDGPGAVLGFLRRAREQPVDNVLLLDEGSPARKIPGGVLELRGLETRRTTEKDDDVVSLGGDEAEKEDVTAAACVAFQRGLDERRLRMKSEDFVTCTDHMRDEMRR